MTFLVKELIDESERIFNFHESANVKPEMEKYGYSEAKMAEGKTLLVDAKAACNSYAKEFGEQLQAFSVYEAILIPCKEHYGKDLEIARFVFRDRADAQSTLELNGRRKHSVVESYSQMVDFYDRLTANAGWVAEMGKMKVTPEMLNDQKSELAKIRKLKDEHSREKGEAQQATVERDQLLEKLNAWVADYTKVAKFALAATPQLLEGLNKVVR